MASPISLHLPDLDAATGSAIARAVARDMEESEQAMSRFRPDAELVALNSRVGEWAVVSPRLYRALSQAWVAYRRSGGLFDPRVLRVLEAIGYAGAGRTASPDLSGPWLARRPREHAVRLGAPVDLGGIGKGLAVRWAARVVAPHTRNYLLNAGGDLVYRGAGPDANGWQVGVEDPARDRAMVAAVRLAGQGAVCTSSTARLRWEHAGRPVHHLIDPRTGQASDGPVVAVTGIGADPAWTEIATKTLLLEGRAIARAAHGKAVLWIDRDGSVHATLEAERFVFWRAPTAD